MILLPPMPKSHRGEPMSRHAEAYMPPYGAARRSTPLHLRHRPNGFLLGSCPGRHCSGQHNSSREVQK